MRRLPVVLYVVYKNDWSSAFLPGCAGVHLPTMTPRVKPPHTLVSVLHCWLWYCRATALSALANLTLLLGKNTLPFPAFGNLNFVSPPHRRAYTSIPKSCPNIRFPHQQDFFPIRSVTKSSMARFPHENLVEKFKIFVQDFVPIRTALRTALNGGTFFFFTSWPEGIVSIPVGQPDPTRPISLTLTQTPLPQLIAWSLFIAAALGHSTVWADFVCVSGSVLSWPTRPNGQPDPTRPIPLTLTQTPQPQLTAWSQFIAGAWS